MKARGILVVVAMLLVAACAPRSTSTVDSAVTTLPSVTATTSVCSLPRDDGAGACKREVLLAVPAVGTTLDRELATSDGRNRTYHLYIPSVLPAGPVPLLIALHGGTGSGTQFQRQSGFDELAEANGFIAVFPDGVGLGSNADRLRTWNGGYCCGTAATQDVDDVGYIDALVDAIAAEYDVDSNRIFAAGHSNGGIMAYRLACELSDRIVAIGLQAGSLGVDPCEPTAPVSVLHLHGTADENHPIEGGEGPKSIAGVSFHSAAFSVETLAAAMNCEAQPTDSVDSTNADLAITSWTQCNHGIEVRLVAVAGAPHSWMSDASVAILEFLLNHPRGQ